MDQSQEMSSEYGYHGYGRIARLISNNNGNNTCVY